MAERGVRVLELLNFAAVGLAFQFGLAIGVSESQTEDVIEGLVRSHIFTTSQHYLVIPKSDGMPFVTLVGVVDDINLMSAKNLLNLTELFESFIILVLLPSNFFSMSFLIDTQLCMYLLFIPLSVLLRFACIFL